MTITALRPTTVRDRRRLFDEFEPPACEMPDQLLTEYVVVPEGFAGGAQPYKDRWAVRVRRVSLTVDEWAVFDGTGSRFFTCVGDGTMWRKKTSDSQFRAWGVQSGRNAYKLAQRIVASLKVDGLTFAEAHDRAVAEYTQLGLHLVACGALAAVPCLAEIDSFEDDGPEAA